MFNWKKYLNIPYAEPPTAKLRFQPPQPKTDCANKNIKSVSGSFWCDYFDQKENLFFIY